MRRGRILLVVVMAALMFMTSDARADGIDLYYVLTRVAPIGSWWSLTLLVPTVMLLNYGLNLLVIGWPVIQARQWPLRAVAKPLLGFTLLGQLADRLGFIAAGVCAGFLMELLGRRGEGAFLVPMVVLSFVFTGMCVGGLALYYLRRRWQLRLGRALAVAAAASVFTNPAWVMLQLWRFK